MLLAWVHAWLLKLQDVDLPSIHGVHLQRDLGTEHRLSLEFDGPTPANPTGPNHPPTPSKEHLLQELTLTVQPTDCTVILKTEGLQQSFELTRKESHAVLEMLAAKARAIGWLEQPSWPGWLGSHDGSAGAVPRT